MRKCVQKVQHASLMRQAAFSCLFTVSPQCWSKNLHHMQAAQSQY